MKVGIDFGSTYSAISAYNEKEDRVESLSLVEGESAAIPSIVSITSKGKVSCGKAAKDQIGKRTTRIFEAFKMLLVEQNREMLQRRGYSDNESPRYITRIFLESLLRGTLRRYGDERFEDIIVCVPEIWCKNLYTLDGRSILRDILKNEISFPVDHVRVVSEPEAASAYFAYHYEQETQKAFNGHLLLIDYGGGTLDITLTEVHSDGNGKMEISYKEGGGAGENHPDANGCGAIGSAGIAYMQRVVTLALEDNDFLSDEEAPDFTSPDFVAAVRDLESQLKSADRMKDLEDTFGSYGAGYADLVDILDDEDIEFITLEYRGEELPVTYQQLYRAYQDTIEGVLRRQIESINLRVAEQIGSDPCDPSAGEQDYFKIALVGGFSSFYLVKKQLADIYRLDANQKLDLRTKSIHADKRELAISLGAALLASGKVVLKKVSRFSIGLYSVGHDRRYQLRYAIRCGQIVEPGKPYFILRNGEKPDTPDNRILFGGLHGNLTHLAIEFSDRTDCGGLMALKPQVLRRLSDLPEEGFWNFGFSMDESDIVSVHIVSGGTFGFKSAGMVIPLDNYAGMFDLTAIKEVTT